MLYRQHQQTIQQEFDYNKINAKNNEIVDPKELVVQKVRENRTNEEEVQDGNNLVTAVEIEEDIRYIRARYCHEKKKIIFIMYTVRKLRDLAKKRQVFTNEICDRFMLISCLLLKKGIPFNLQVLESLKKKKNIFNLKHYSEFLKKEDIPKIYQNFQGDQNIYDIF